MGSAVVAEDDDDLRDLVCMQLEKAGFEVFPAADGREALDLVTQRHPDLVILDADMPVKSGYEVLEDIDRTIGARVILLTAQDQATDIVKGLALGAVDHIAKPFDSSVLLARVMVALRTKRHEDDLLRERNALGQLAATDALTGLANRRSAETQFDAMVAAAARTGHDIAVIMIDIDHFKVINDTYGHETGDVVLQRLARAILDALRTDDVASRWGGEEFLVLLPRTEVAGAMVVAERIRDAVERLEIPTARTAESGVPLRVTASLGYASWRDRRTNVLKAADAALYGAKAAGRNRVMADAHRDSRI